MCAIVVSSGTTCVIGLATVSVARCEAVQVQQIVNMFLTRVRLHSSVSKTSPIVPIIECNNNEVCKMRLVLRSLVAGGAGETGAHCRCTI